MNEDDIPTPKVPNPEPCRCQKGPDVYNHGQFHMKGGNVIDRCGEYQLLAQKLRNGEAALPNADPTHIDTQRLKNKLTLLKVRLDELKAGGRP